MSIESLLRDMVRQQTQLERAVNTLREQLNRVIAADTRIHLGRAQTIYIASGVLTVDAHTHIRVGPETLPSDDLDTITPIHAGQVLLLFPLTDTQITVKNGTGNITLANGDAVLDANHKNVTVMYSANLASWFEIARSA